MLLFRSEEHARGWCAARGEPFGYATTAGMFWHVARTWFDGRLDDAPLTRTIDEKQQILTATGLTGPFWELPR